MLHSYTECRKRAHNLLATAGLLVLTGMNKKLVLESENLEFYVKMYLLSLNLCGMIMDMKDVRCHLQTASIGKLISLPTCVLFPYPVLNHTSEQFCKSF